MDAIAIDLHSGYNHGGDNGNGDPAQSLAAAFRPSGPPPSSGPPRQLSSDCQATAGTSTGVYLATPTFAPGFGPSSAAGESHVVEPSGPPGYKGRLPAASASSALAEGSAPAAVSPQGPLSAARTSGAPTGAPLSDGARVQNPPTGYGAYPPGMLPSVPPGSLHATSEPQASSNGSTGPAASSFSGPPAASSGVPSCAPSRAPSWPPSYAAQAGQPSAYHSPSDPHLRSAPGSSANGTPSHSSLGPPAAGLPGYTPLSTAPHQSAGLLSSYPPGPPEPPPSHPTVPPYQFPGPPPRHPRGQLHGLLATVSSGAYAPPLASNTCSQGASMPAVAYLGDVPALPGCPRAGFLLDANAAGKREVYPAYDTHVPPFAGFSPPASPLPDDLDLQPALDDDVATCSPPSPDQAPAILGYDAKFVPPLSEEYKCTICTYALRDPVQVRCNHRHRFCRLCIEALIMSGMTYCPKDYTPISLGEIVLDEQCHKDILSRTVQCDEASIGCSWRGCLQNLQAHLDTDCEFQLRPCPNAGIGCKKRLQQRNMDDHIASYCQFISVQCEQCAARVVGAHYEEHLSQCPEVEQQCPSGCGAMILGKQIEAHVSESCPLAKEECQYGSYGCNAKVHRSGHEEHMRDGAHHHVDLLREAVECERREKDSLRREVSSLRDSLQGLERRLAASALLQEETLQATVERACREMMNQHAASVREDMVQLEQRLASQEGAVQVEYVDAQVAGLKGVIQETQQCSETMERSIGQMAGQIATMREESSSLANLSDATETMLNSLDIRLLSLETTSYSGIYVWKIPDYSRRADDAATAQKKSLLSPPFYTSRHGYKMCARLYPHGDGLGKKSHVSVFFVLMRGEYDALLSWPFRQKVTLTLLDQSSSASSGKHISDTFKPDPASSSFERPKSEMNVASGCPRFVPLETVRYDRDYIRDDVMYVRIAVNTADLQNRY